MEEVNVNVTPHNGVLEIREGQAIPLKEPVKIDIVGNIDAVSSFLKVRSTSAINHQCVSKMSSIVTVDRKNMSIRLQTNPNDVYGTVITGKLELSDELKAFSINTAKTFSKQELVKLLRFNRMHFADMDIHAKVLGSYQKFSASANTDIKDESDLRGNKLANFQKKVKTDIPDNFVLNLPIFKGREKKTFRVEICLDVTDGGACFWFESVELNEIITRQRDEIIDGELKSCKDLVIIEI